MCEVECCREMRGMERMIILILNKFGIFLWRVRGGFVHGKYLCSVGRIKDLIILATCSE